MESSNRASSHVTAQPTLDGRYVYQNEALYLQKGYYFALKDHDLYQLFNGHSELLRTLRVQLLSPFGLACPSGYSAGDAPVGPRFQRLEYMESLVPDRMASTNCAGQPTCRDMEGTVLRRPQLQT